MIFPGYKAWDLIDCDKNNTVIRKKIFIRLNYSYEFNKIIETKTKKANQNG